jgi:hypothetical protein
MPYPPEGSCTRAVYQDPSIQTPRGLPAQALTFPHELLDFLSEAEIDNLVRESPRFSLFAKHRTHRLPRGEGG